MRKVEKTNLGMLDALRKEIQNTTIFPKTYAYIEHTQIYLIVPYADTYREDDRIEFLNKLHALAEKHNFKMDFKEYKDTCRTYLVTRNTDTSTPRSYLSYMHP